MCYSRCVLCLPFRLQSWCMEGPHLRRTQYNLNKHCKGQSTRLLQTSAAYKWDSRTKAWLSHSRSTDRESASCFYSPYGILNRLPGTQYLQPSQHGSNRVGNIVVLLLSGISVTHPSSSCSVPWCVGPRYPTDFSYFQSRRTSRRTAPMPPKRSSAGMPAFSASAASVTVGNAGGWDPIMYDAPCFAVAPTALSAGTKTTAATAGHSNLTMQQRLNEYSASAGMVSALLEIAKTRPLSKRSVTPLCASRSPPLEEASYIKRLDTAQVPRSSRVFQDNG